MYLVLWLVGLVTAGLTAFYTFRAYFMTFWGEERIPHEAFEHHHGHAAHGETPHLESPPVMTIPLDDPRRLRAWVSVSRWDRLHLFGHFVAAYALACRTPRTKSISIATMMAISSLVALGGIGVAWLMYVRQPDLPARLARAAPGTVSIVAEQVPHRRTVRCVHPQAAGGLHGVHAHLRSVRARWFGRSDGLSSCAGWASGFVRCRTAWCSSTPWRWCWD